jgi:hypothetical protein
LADELLAPKSLQRFGVHARAGDGRAIAVFDRALQTIGRLRVERCARQQHTNRDQYRE